VLQVNDQYAVRAARLWERVLAKIKEANGGDDWRGGGLQQWAERVESVWQYGIREADHELSFVNLVKYNQHHSLEQELEELKNAFAKACHDHWAGLDAGLVAAGAEEHIENKSAMVGVYWSGSLWLPRVPEPLQPSLQVSTSRLEI
jgi:hypothetical protein